MSNPGAQNDASGFVANEIMEAVTLIISGIISTATGLSMLKKMRDRRGAVDVKTQPNSEHKERSQPATQTA